MIATTAPSRTFHVAADTLQVVREVRVQQPLRVGVFEPCGLPVPLYRCAGVGHRP